MPCVPPAEVRSAGGDRGRRLSAGCHSTGVTCCGAACPGLDFGGFAAVFKQFLPLAGPAFSGSAGLCSSRAHLAADLRETRTSFVSLALSCCPIKGCKSVCRLGAARWARQLKVCVR